MIRKKLSDNAVATIAEHLREAGVNHVIELPSAHGILVTMDYGYARTLEVPIPEDGVLPENIIRDYVHMRKESSAAVCLILPVLENAMANTGTEHQDQYAVIVQTLSHVVNVLEQRYGQDAERILKTALTITKDRKKMEKQEKKNGKG